MATKKLLMIDSEKPQAGSDWFRQADQLAQEFYTQITPKMTLGTLSPIWAKYLTYVGTKRLAHAMQLKLQEKPFAAYKQGKMYFQE